ncbi:MAG: hypothetical protein KAR33_02575 [Candidatus Thorarchaeota archaeon]|nr:hypothetical protein [Candidatus Thorarchaeota archaeon]
MTVKEKMKRGSRGKKSRSSAASSKKKTQSGKGNLVFMDSPMSSWAQRNEV